MASGRGGASEVTGSMRHGGELSTNELMVDEELPIGGFCSGNQTSR